MSVLRQLLKRPFANRIGYELLRHQVKLCHWLMGIGSGGALNESGERSIVKKLLRESAGRPLTVFDIGANKGQFLGMLLKELNGHLESVHSFEPGCQSFSLLKETPHGSVPVKFNQCAVSDKPGRAELFYDKAGSELASLTQRDLSFKNRNFDEHESVELITLDKYCDDHKITQIDWLKIDVEGHELDVLRGGVEMIKSEKVGLITMEFGGANIDTRTFFRDFYHFFESTPMQLHRITPGGYIHPIRKYRETEEQFITMNLAAFSPSRKK